MNLNDILALLQNSNFWACVMLFFGLAGIGGILGWMGMLTQDKDNGVEIRKTLGIIGGVSGLLIFFFGIAAYNYFSVNVNYLTPFVFIMSFVNLFLSMFAVSAASLQIVKS
jgi:hypothetical protein